MKVRFFDRAALEQRLKMADVLDVVEGVYKSKAEGKTVVWPTVTHHFEDRGAVMDIRSGYDRGSEVYGAKLLATFPENEKRGLPPFSGILVAMDGTTGLPKGIMDASFITSMRTGAAAAVSARALARPESDTLLVLGTGRQSLFMIGAALTGACIDCAKEAGFWQLELEVVGDNETAVRLYKKYGFVEYGRNPRGFLTRDGRWQELVLMRLELEDTDAQKIGAV